MGTKSLATLNKQTRSSSIRADLSSPQKEESIQTIFKMSQYTGKLIVTGCLAQRYEQELKEQIPEIKAVIPIKDYGNLAARLQDVLHDEGKGAF